MNPAELRSKRVIVPTVAAVAILAVGGTVWTATASDDVRGGERDRVGNAATRAVGGTVVDVETSDDPGEAYEVEVRLDDGTETDVALDEDLNVVARDADDREDRDDPDGASDSDDRALSASERASAEKAALTAVGGGTVIDVEAGDDRGTAYDVEVRAADNTEWDVELDASYEVLRKTADD
jgi:uncharacterized membrane protein YkoI